MTRIALYFLLLSLFFLSAKGKVRNKEKLRNYFEGLTIENSALKALYYIAARV